MARWQRSTLWLCLGICTGGTCPGCKREPALTLFPAIGRVTVEGRTLKAGKVAFRPYGERGNSTMHLPHGSIDQGKYEMFTAGRAGAPPGWYKVLIFADNFSADPPEKKGGTVEGAKSLVHGRYLDVQLTDLLVEVVEKPEPGAYDLKLRR